MEVYLAVRFDRPITEDGWRAYSPFSPGGYAVKAGGKEYQFDFMDSAGHITRDDPAVLSWMAWNPDRSSFPEIAELEQHLPEINAFTECFIYIDDDCFPPGKAPNVERIEAFEITAGCMPETVPYDTPFLHCEEAANGMIRFQFTKKLLRTLPRFTEE